MASRKEGHQVLAYFEHFRATAWDPQLQTGRKQPDELDGPEEMHVVFLDNGRSKLLGSEFEEALACIRCGACLNTCPVYRQSGGHAYGSPYSGPIGAVLSPLYWGMDDFGHLAHASTLCGACYEVCPVGLRLSGLARS